ncbi:hypothetical protein KCU78_g3888, partial [Aureobasidium melanogenum]
MVNSFKGPRLPPASSIPLMQQRQRSQQHHAMMHDERWIARLNNVVTLFNNKQFFLARKEARALLNLPELDLLHRMWCLILLARAVDDRDEAKVSLMSSCASNTVLTGLKIYHDDADRIWRYIRHIWPAKNLIMKGNRILDKARLKIDDLNADLLADTPNDNDCLDGLEEYQVELAEGEKEPSAKSAEGNPFEKDVEMTGQKEKNSQSKVGSEIALISLKAMAAETSYERVSSRTLEKGLSGLYYIPRSFFHTNMEGVCSEKPLMVSHMKKKRDERDALGHTPGQAEKKKAAIPGPSVSKPRQVQDRNIALPGPSITPIKEKENTNIDKPEMILRDVPDKLSSDEDVTVGKVEKLTMTEIFHLDQHDEALKSKPSLPGNVKRPASIRYFIPYVTYSDHSASAPQQAKDVSAQAENSRSSSTSVLDVEQVELPNLSSAPLS